METTSCRHCLQTHPGCRAHRKQKNGGGACGAPPMANGVCAAHGGKSPKGIGHPNYRHGEFSRYKPKKLLARINRSLADPEPLKFLADVHLVQARMDELLERLDQQEHTSLALWSEANAAFSEFNQARGRGHVEKMGEQLARLDRALQAGREDGRLWDEIFRAQERKRRLAESETKRLVLCGKMMPLDELGILIDQIVETIREQVTDRDVLQKISDRLGQILGRQ